MSHEPNDLSRRAFFRLWALAVSFDEVLRQRQRHPLPRVAR